jgi:hypothetical protein
MEPDQRNSGCGSDWSAWSACGIFVRLNENP